jgi:hypothetical protein
MADPTCAELFDKEMNSYYLKIEKLEKKLKKFELEELFVVSYCVLYYQREEDKIVEVSELLDIVPLNRLEANSLENEVNELKDLPNVEVKSYKEAINEKISQEKGNIARLNKSF